MARSCRFSLPVAVVVTAIAYIYLSTVFVFIDQWLGLWSSPGMLNAVAFTTVAIMCVSSYALAVFTDPGRVPHGFAPDIEDAESPIHEIKRKVLLVGSLTVDSPKDEQQSESSYRTVYVISGLLLVPLSVALTYFLWWHLSLTLRNKTTIEYHEGVRAMWLAEKGGDVYSHPYDLGAYENLIAVLGPNFLCWIFPRSTHIGSGLRFPTAYDKLGDRLTSK